MTVTEAPTRSLGRPAATPEDLEVAAFRRIADLASSVLACIRKPGRIRYRSERQLRAWLAEDGISFTTGDIAPALTLLEAVAFIQRATVKPNAPRPGWLTSAAEKVAERGLTVNVNTTTALVAALEDASEAATRPR